MAMNCCYNEPHGIAANRPASPSFNTWCALAVHMHQNMVSLLTWT